MKKLFFILLISFFIIWTANADCWVRSNYSDKYWNINWNLIDVLVNLWNKLVTKSPEKVDIFISTLETFWNRSWLSLKQKDIIWVLGDYFICRKTSWIVSAPELTQTNTCSSSDSVNYKSVMTFPQEYCVREYNTVCDNTDCSYFHVEWTRNCENKWKTNTDLWENYISYMEKWYIDYSWDLNLEEKWEFLFRSPTVLFNVNWMVLSDSAWVKYINNW